MSGSRRDDARLDALIHEQVLRDTGVVEDDEPTEYSHRAYMAKFHREASGDFTAEERMIVRAKLGLGPFAEGYVP